MGFDIFAGTMWFSIGFQKCGAELHVSLRIHCVGFVSFGAMISWKLKLCAALGWRINKTNGTGSGLQPAWSVTTVLVHSTIIQQGPDREFTHTKIRNIAVMANLCYALVPYILKLY